MKNTYSFLDVLAAIVGPGGGFQIGAGAGAAPEGITTEPSQEINNMQVGADGSVVHSLRADRSGKVTIRLLKTSPTNALLMGMFEFQRTSAANHGQNTLTITNKVSGDVVVCQQVAFSKQPPNAYAMDANIIEWMFDAGNIQMGLGAGVL